MKNVTCVKLHTQKGVERVDTRLLVRIEAISNYSKLYFSNGKTLVVAKLLQWFEKNLPGTEFIRVHRTHIVNNSQICNTGILYAGRLKLNNGELIAVSRRRKYKVLHMIPLLN